MVEQLEGLTIARAFGESSRPPDEFMDSPALSPNMPPPLPAGLGSAELRKSAIPDVILEADPIAHSIPICEGPDIDPGLCKKPERFSSHLCPAKIRL